jgi:urease accessory protein
MIINQIIPQNKNIKVNLEIELTAEERQKSRQRIEENNLIIQLQLPRGTVLKEGDLISNENQDFMIKIIAKSENVITVTSENQLALIKGAYHLGNRHIPLEININYLRLLPDPVLKIMLLKLGLEIKEENVPFFPEVGAYNH